MNTLGKNINQDQFKNWNYKRKSTLVLGVFIIIFTSLVWISNWCLNTLKATTALNKLDQSIIKEMQEQNLNVEMISRCFRSIMTFTFITNYAAGIIITYYAHRPQRLSAQKASFLATAYISITLVIFWTLIFPEFMTIRKKNTNIALGITTCFVHFVNPTLTLIAFGINRKNIHITYKNIRLSFIPVFIYYLFALALFWITQPVAQYFITDDLMELNKYVDSDVVIYGFLNFKEPFFYTKGVTWIVILLNIAMLASVLAIGPLFTILIKWIFGIKIPKTGTKMDHLCRDNKLAK